MKNKPTANLNDFIQTTDPITGEFLYQRKEELQPITFGEYNAFCDPQCPFLEHRRSEEIHHYAICKRDGKEIFYYDWYLNHCVEENYIEEESE